MSQYPACSRTSLTQEFLEEKVSYCFLDTLRPEFHLFPQMYFCDEKGFIVLEDLASGEQGNPDTMQTLARNLAFTLASLHLATMGKCKTYQELRRDAGLPDPDNDTRAYGFTAHRRRYRLTAAAFKDYCAILSIPLTHTYDEIIASVEGEMENPDMFFSLIHDDLANGRQIIKQDGQFYLIDFENAKFSHALLDISKPLAGKFETFLENGRYFYNNPEFPMTFVDEYRLALNALGGVTYEDARWEIAVCNALVYHCFALLGKLIEISGSGNLTGSFTYNFKAIMQRLLFLLKNYNTYSELKSSLSKLTNKLIV